MKNTTEKKEVHESEKKYVCINIFIKYDKIYISNKEDS